VEVRHELERLHLLELGDGAHRQARRLLVEVVGLIVLEEARARMERDVEARARLVLLERWGAADEAGCPQRSEMPAELVLKDVGLVPQRLKPPEPLLANCFIVLGEFQRSPTFLLVHKVREVKEDPLVQNEADCVERTQACKVKGRNMATIYAGNDLWV
jgi:hypothetical protein